ncbi:MAG: hypothetical protein ACJ73L_07220 [Actinomycetes bacterium]
MTDAEVKGFGNLSLWYEDPAYRLPMSGHPITHDHVSALAAIILCEGRPLARDPSSSPAAADSVRRWAALPDVCR